ncbi:MAG TPA: Ig-like domain-containing protein [Terracidiphilus sp.]|nr:Ig-like domain-containing protein [Terracidiphilus sp.]
MLGEDKVSPDRGIAHPRTPRATQTMMHLRCLGLSLAASLLGGPLVSSAAVFPVKPALLPVTVTLAANNVSVAQGRVVILTATVTPMAAPPASGEQNPTGTITFYIGTTAIGQSTLAALPVDNASTATLTIQNLPAGQDSITASYAGDPVFASGTSDPLAINVEGFTLAPAATNPATNLNIARGQSGSESFVVTSAGGYTGQVQVVCAVQLQDDMTCTPTPQQVVPTATVTFSIQTFATGGPLYATASTTRRHISFWPLATLGSALAAIFFFAIPFSRRWRASLLRGSRRVSFLVMLLVPLLTMVTNCNSSRVLAGNGTPLGVATLKVTATAYVDNAVTSQTVYFTVNVQPQ